MNMQEAKNELREDYRLMAMMVHETGTAGIYPSGRSGRFRGKNDNWYYEWVIHNSKLWRPKNDTSWLFVGHLLTGHISRKHGKTRKLLPRYDSWIVEGFNSYTLRKFCFSNQEKAEARKEAKEKLVYFILGGELIKVGLSIDIERRMKTLCAQSPVPLQLLAVARGGRQYEQQIHNEFINDLDHNEWFVPSDRLWALIKKHQEPSKPHSILSF